MMLPDHGVDLWGAFYEDDTHPLQDTAFRHADSMRPQLEIKTGKPFSGFPVFYSLYGGEVRRHFTALLFHTHTSPLPSSPGPGR